MRGGGGLVTAVVVIRGCRRICPGFTAAAVATGLTPPGARVAAIMSAPCCADNLIACVTGCSTRGPPSDVGVPLKMTAPLFSAAAPVGVKMAFVPTTERTGVVIPLLAVALLVTVVAAGAFSSSSVKSIQLPRSFVVTVAAGLGLGGVCWRTVGTVPTAPPRLGALVLICKQWQLASLTLVEVKVSFRPVNVILFVVPQKTGTSVTQQQKKAEALQSDTNIYPKLLLPNTADPRAFYMATKTHGGFRVS